MLDALVCRRRWTSPRSVQRAGHHAGFRSRCFYGPVEKLGGDGRSDRVSGREKDGNGGRARLATRLSPDTKALLPCSFSVSVPEKAVL